MALTVKHSTVVVVPDDGLKPVGTNEWNAAHTITGTLDAAGSSGNVQYNNSGTFGGFGTYNNSTLELTTPGFLNVAGAVQPVAPSAGGTHWPIMLEYVYNNAQMEGTVFDFSGGLHSSVSGHKTSGAMGQMNALIANTEMQVDAGATIRALQAAHFTAHLTGTGRSTVGIQTLQIENTCDLDDTVGRCGYMSAAEVFANVNSCAIMDAPVWGLVSQVFTGASATIPQFVGALIANVISSPAVVTENIVIDIQNGAGPGSIVGTSKGINLQAPGGTAVATNHTGLWIGDQSGFGTTSSYNILSKNPDAIFTPASTVGGNLFQGHSAFGNAAEVDKTTFSAADPANEFRITYEAPLLMCDYQAGGPNMFNAGLVVYPSFKPSGTGNYVAGMDFNAFVNSDATGDITSFAGIIGYTVNYGTGDITIRQYGNWAQAEHWGTGVVEELVGQRCGTVSSTNGIVTNAYGTKCEASALAQTVTNHYGVYIMDQSAIGSTRSENIRSVGASSRNVFEGLIHFGTGTNSSPQDGDVWFDGTNLKLRTGGTTKTITAV